VAATGARCSSEKMEVPKTAERCDIDPGRLGLLNRGAQSDRMCSAAWPKAFCVPAEAANKHLGAMASKSDKEKQAKELQDLAHPLFLGIGLDETVAG
jgi:hypothetical protein